MVNLIGLSEARLRIYKLLREGQSQAQVCHVTELPKTTVLKAARWFVAQGFLVQIGGKKPYIYGAGPRAGELDAIVVTRGAHPSATNGVHHDATSVTKVSPTRDSVNFVRSHHIKVRFRVEKIGDMELLRIKDNGSSVDLPFLEPRPYLDYHNVRRTKGKVPYGKETLSVELEESSAATWFYVHLPELKLTKQELPDWETRYSAMGQQVANFVQKWGGWQLGMMEFCTAWKPHFSTEDPRILEQIAGKLSGKNHDGTVWLSDSEGRRELETSRPEYASVIMALPEEVYELRLRVSNLLELVKMLVEADEDLAKLEASRIEKEGVGYLMGK